jgi:oxaloacetate decarboxylase beta subunit
MWVIGLAFLWLAIKKNVEPLLLLPIGFTILIVNIPLADLVTYEGSHRIAVPGLAGGEVGILNYFYHYALRTEIVPCLIFLGLGAMTDFGPLIANPKTVLLGGAAQVGVFVAFFGALLLGFDLREACSIGIIGGADGPTTIYVTSKLAPHLIGGTAISAYSYMALVPILQPPLIRLLTSPKERALTMPRLRPASTAKKIAFPVMSTLVVCVLVPKAAPLIGMLMLGNLCRESGVVARLSDCASNELANIVTIFLGISVGATMHGKAFLTPGVLMIYVLGLVAFSFGTCGGLLCAKLMNVFLKDKINPLLGAAGVSAVPMAARVVQQEGLKANPRNHLLMHAMAPNVAGVIGTIIVAAVFLALVR